MGVVGLIVTIPDELQQVDVKGSGFHLPVLSQVLSKISESMSSLHLKYKVLPGA